MGLLEREIGEIRGLLVRYNNDNAGPMTKEIFMTNLTAYNQVDKRIKSLLMVHTFRNKFGKKALMRLNATQLTTDGAVVPLMIEEIEYEKIYCPIMKMEITRQRCLDYSGEETHHEECKGCKTGISNKRILCKTD